MIEEEKKTEDADAIVNAADASAKQSSAASATTDTSSPVVDIRNLTFHYDTSKSPNIVGLNCHIVPNSKIILVGANGAGKSTLLRILTGQIFMGMKSEKFEINGMNRANDQFNGVAYLGGTWKRRRTGFEGVCPYTSELPSLRPSPPSHCTVRIAHHIPDE
jgi:ABC-type transport system involved in cytochrome bd biosynthesis fused ATPase/permease subunit